MKKGFTLLCMLLLALNLWACGSSGGDDAGDSAVDSSAATSYTIQGTILADGVALADATVQLSGDENRTTTTDDTGTYTFPDLAAGDYVVTPSTATGYEYGPESISVTLGDGDAAVQDFSAAWAGAPVYLHYYLPDQYNYELDGGPVSRGIA